MTTIGQRLKQLRQERGWSQTKLAERSGLTHSAISYIESGSRVPGSMSLWKLAEGLDVTMDDLYPKAPCRSSRSLEGVTR